MTSPGVNDWDPLVVPVDDAAEPLDAGADCSHEMLAPTEPSATQPPEGSG